MKPPLEITISQFTADNKKYSDYRGNKFTVFNQVDNFGDYCILIDMEQPFMFISAKDCLILPCAS